MKFKIYIYNYQIARHDDIYHRLQVNIIAPEIFGHEDIKKAVASQLFSGVRQVWRVNMDDVVVWRVNCPLCVCLVGSGICEGWIWTTSSCEGWTVCSVSVSFVVYFKLLFFVFSAFTRRFASSRGYSYFIARVWHSIAYKRSVRFIYFLISLFVSFLQRSVGCEKSIFEICRKMFTNCCLHFWKG